MQDTQQQQPPSRFSASYDPDLNCGYAFPPDKIKNRGATALEHFSTQYAWSGDPAEWQQRLESGQVVHQQNGTPVKPDTLLRAGDCLVYTRAPWQEADAPNYFDVLLEDDQVLAVCKPSGLQVVPKGEFSQRTLVWLLQQYHQQHRSSRFPNSLVPVPVHRLGRGTSGVLLCACTQAARRQLCKDFATATDIGTAAVAAVAAEPSQSGGAQVSQVQERPLGKQYRALVTGRVEQDEGEVRVPIGLVEYPGFTTTGLFAATSSESTAGKPSLSRYRVLARYQDSTLVEVTIYTGRPHQIRIHMAAIGHPLVGDPLYGPGGVPQPHVLQGCSRGAYGGADYVLPGDCGYHLHSMTLQFRHPSTGESVTIQAPVPPVLQTPEEQQAAAAR